MNDKLIYDIGCNNGDDTAFYLYNGYNVVSVDANPISVVNCKSRFAKEISEGRLTVLNYGIADEMKDMLFYINTVNSQHSSFIESIGRRNDDRTIEVTVKCVALSHLIFVHGMPVYIKIDIEGYDKIALRGLTAYVKPEYISIEYVSDDCIDELMRLGYNVFKFVDQSDVTIQDGDDWEFPKFLSSGRFGENAPGDWITEEEIRGLLKIRTDEKWYDIHAKQI